MISRKISNTINVYVHVYNVYVYVRLFIRLI